MNLDSKNKNTNTKLFFTLLFILIFAVGFVLGSTFFPNISKKADTSFVSSDLSKFNDIIQTLNDKFYYRDKLQSSNIEDSTIKGYVSGLSDFPTRYLNTQEYSQYQDALGGNIFGIGIELGLNGTEGTKIYSVYSSSPAEKAGLQKDDVFISIDGTDVTKSDPSDVATLVRGKEGTDVQITIVRGGKQLTFKVTRAKVYSQSVTYEKLDSNVCRINIKRFTDDSVDTWEKNWDSAVDKYIKDDCQKLIIDLRDNGGGYVEAAKYALEEFIADGTVIYGQKDPSGNIQKILSNRDSSVSSGQITNHPAGRLRNVQPTIMINSNTASASEIFSGGLQNLGKAKLIGTNSFGKGSVQDTKVYEDKSALIYTIANWTLPNGQIIDQNFPIKPNVVVSFDSSYKSSTNDNVLDKAVQLVNQ